MFAVGLWFTRSTLTLDGPALGLSATALSVGALSQMGACFAALVLRHQQVTAIFGLFNFAFQMLTGMFIPLQLLPASSARTSASSLFPRALAWTCCGTI